MLDVTLDLSRLVAQVSRLANAAEALVEIGRCLLPPLPADAPEIHQATLADLHVIDPVAQEREKEKRRELAERFGVVPDSLAFELALEEYEREMAHLHPNEPVNWNEAFT